MCDFENCMLFIKCILTRILKKSDRSNQRKKAEFFMTVMKITSQKLNKLPRSRKVSGSVIK